MFEPLPAQVDLPALEREVLERWNDDAVFERSLADSAERPLWVFYEGPPTANGRPGTHHVEARVFKDLFPRFKTMKGYHVPRRAGWDCHGLPVELAVEKELGFTSKQDIETYGIAAFNERCRESVQRHVAEFEELTARMGMWVDMGSAYRTMDPGYIESVWWSLQQIFNAGLLVEDYRVAPYCPRCETGLSDHEVAQGYSDVVDPSVYVRFPVTSGPLLAFGADLLVWTTTPWTLVSNTAVAVHPDVTYVVARAATGEVLVVAEPLLVKALGDGAQTLASFTGRELEHSRYERPFDVLDIPDAHYVVLADYVTVEDGSGLVHQAPAFGADDIAVARAYNLPIVNPIGPNGHFQEGLALVGGQFFKDADAGLVTHLREQGRLWRAAPYAHKYPFCWRCDTALLYYALPSWYIRTTAAKNRLLAENAITDWHPVTIRDGRYGDWLSNNVDWALSRKRYWGTPLPVWRCADSAEHLTCVGSLAELSALSGQDCSALDPHRPFVDDITLPCPVCKAIATRVPEVIDCWYDAGSMPFAQIGYPHQAGSSELALAYPADFIAEAIDQTRGWFYTLMAIGTMVFDRSPYRTVLCLGHILDADGRKMSKHLGNVLDPFELFERHGADAVRWLMLATGNPWAARRVGHEALDEIVRQVLLRWWNTTRSFTLYAAASSWTPADSPAAAGRPVMDRWALSELQATVAEVNLALEDFDTVRAGRRLASFIDDLSNWYLRRSRRRLWDGDSAAFATMHECLTTLTKLMAPFTPFLSDALWCALVPDGDSVHLQAFPEGDVAVLNPSLSARMAAVLRVVELGRAARAESGVKTRQPLGRALVGGVGFNDLTADLRQLICEELNVATLDALRGVEELVEVTVKANFRALGKRLGAGVQPVAAALAAADAPALVATLRAEGQVCLDVEGHQVTVTTDEVILTEAPRSGWAVASADGVSVALDLHLSDELRLAGLAREVVRLVQETRKSTGLDISDRIELWWAIDQPGGAGADLLARALREHGALIAAEVLAIEFREGHPVVEVARHRDDELGLTFWLRQAGL